MLRIVLIWLFAFLLSACTLGRSAQPEVSAGTTRPTVCAPKTVDVSSKPKDLPALVCPTTDDVRESIDELQRLSAETTNIVDKKDLESRTSFGAKEETWIQKNKALISGSQLLAGASGVQVHPEIPLALENLARAQNWLHTAVFDSSERKTSMKLIHHANVAIERATNLMDGDVVPDARTALVKLPKQLEKNIENIRRSVAATDGSANSPGIPSR
ncbi:MAG TPA: hypothetical protein V6D17_15055 [Candidatus Obscuribacterales bacterium]